MIKTFQDLGLNEKILKSIDELGYTTPSKIQEQIIPIILEGYDVIGQASTGTGKTLAFASSILSKLNVDGDVIKALILVPTRELALQVCEEFHMLNKTSKLDVLSVYGGSNIDAQIKTIKKGVDIIVGTPGRVMDLMKRKVLNIKDLEYFVLDEVDEMLNMGFLEDIQFIFQYINNKNKQVLLFSATISDEIKKLAEAYMKDNYQHIHIKEATKTSANVTHSYYLVTEKIRTEAICRVIDIKDINKGIIFCATKRECDKLLSELSNRNYSAEAMHGDISQASRIETLERFKKGTFKILIATDVAARGIHVNDVECVINYNTPQDVESYIHRIGRTGRASKKGEAISFVSLKEVRFLNSVEKAAKCEIVKCELPNTMDIVKAKYEKNINIAKEMITNNDHEEAISYIRDFNKADLFNLTAALLKMSVNNEIGSDLTKQISVSEVNKKLSPKGTTRVFLTIGKMDNIKKGSLLDFLKDATKIDKDHFKNIEILTKFTFIDIDDEKVDEAMQKIQNKKMNNRVIRIEIAKGRK